MLLTAMNNIAIRPEMSPSYHYGQQEIRCNVLTFLDGRKSRAQTCEYNGGTKAKRSAPRRATSIKNKRRPHTILPSVRSTCSSSSGKSSSFLLSIKASRLAPRPRRTKPTSHVAAHKETAEHISAQIMIAHKTIFVS